MVQSIGISSSGIWGLRFLLVEATSMRCGPRYSTIQALDGVCSWRAKQPRRMGQSKPKVAQNWEL